MPCTLLTHGIFTAVPVLKNNNRSGIGLSHALDQFILSVRQRKIREVHPFRFPVVRKNNDDVGTLRQFGGCSRIPPGVKVDLGCRHGGAQCVQGGGGKPHRVLPMRGAPSWRHDRISAWRIDLREPPPEIIATSACPPITAILRTSLLFRGKIACWFFNRTMLSSSIL